MLCAVNGAFVPAFAKLTTGRADAQLVATITALFAGSLAAAVLALRGELRLLARSRLVAVGLLGTALAFVLLYEGAQRTSATEVALCLQTEPAYALVAARIFLGHPITPRRLGSVALLLAGIAFALGARLSGSIGVALLLVAPLCWQASHVLVLRGLHGVHPSVLTGARYLYGGLLLGLYALVSGLGELPRGAALASLLTLLALQGAVLAYLGTMMWYAALRRLDLARLTSIVVPSIPLLSIAASFVLLGEVPSARQGIGFVLAAAGILGFVTAPHPLEELERIPTATAPVAVEREALPPKGSEARG